MSTQPRQQTQRHKAQTVCPREYGDEGIYTPGDIDWPGHVRGSRSCECLSWFARGHHDRGNLSGSSHWHGRTRVWKGSLLEENIARTAGSIGEGLAAGAIFTIPAFVISGAWPSFGWREAYWKTTALCMVGSILGVLFISLVRRVMVEDPELPFPESVAASEIHKAGQRGAQAAKYLFWNIGVGGLVYILGKFGLFAADQDIPFRIGNLGHTQLRLGTLNTTKVVPTGGTSVFAAPSVSPAYLGVGYIIGVKLASIQFAGSVLAWGLLVPLMIYFLGPELKQYIPADTPANWADMADAVWRYIVRPIAVGGMLVGAAYTLFKMRKSLTSGFSKLLADMRQSADERSKLSRTEQYMSFKTVLGLIGIAFLAMCVLYIRISGLIWPAVVAAVVMLIVGFFFATVSGNLVGFIGSSNNPVSGLTLSTLLIAALLMVSLGVSGGKGVAVVLGVAAVVCVSSSVAGELLQDFKVGYILGGTPQKIQMAELIAVVVASLVMYWPLMLLHQANSGYGWVWWNSPSCTAGGLDGHTGTRHRGRGYAVDACSGRRSVRHRDDHDAGEESHAGSGWYVPAIWYDFRNFCWRRFSFCGRLAGGTAWSKSGTKSTRRKRWRACGLRTHCR